MPPSTTASSLPKDDDSQPSRQDPVSSKTSSQADIPFLPIFQYPEEREKVLTRLIGPANLAGRHSYNTRPKHDNAITHTVSTILDSIRQSGDSALIDLAQKYDGIKVSPKTLSPKDATHDVKNSLGAKDLRIDPALLQSPPTSLMEELPSDFLPALRAAEANIRAFHEAELKTIQPLTYTGVHGEKLSLRKRPMKAVGLYIPGGSGGTTPLISTLLMNAIPAKLAGVERIVVMTPPRADGSIAPALLAALSHLGLSEVYTLGGAQAIAALAYGTQTLEPVDFISGPGNAYVTEAKRQVYGQVGIESLAGHSEIVIFSDGSHPSAYIASDLLSQAEHAGGELAVLISSDPEHSLAVQAEIAKMLPTLSRRELIEQSLRSRGAIINVNTTKQGESDAFELINAIAPEHLELLIKDAEDHLDKIDHAGAIFLSAWASEPIGDYIAGTNHVLPTNGSPRFASPLGVHHFFRSSNVIAYNEKAFRAEAPHAQALARAEKLSAHAHALDVRLRSPN